MQIHCPLCGYSRDVDETQIPAKAQMATCPRCQHKFRFRVVDVPEAEPAPPQFGQPSGQSFGQQPGQPGQDSGLPADDPLAAQRAAAAEAWKRLQGARPGEQPGIGQDQGPAAQPAHSAEPAKSAGQASPVPFEDLPRHGFFPGIWGTITQVMRAPAEFFRSMPRAGGMGKPLVFYLLVSEFSMFCQFSWGLLGFGAMAEFFKSQEFLKIGMGMASFAPLLFFVLVPLTFVLTLLAMTAVTHLLLLLTRSGGGGAEATFRVLCYASAPFVLGVIPFIGSAAAQFWSLALVVIGLKVAHRAPVAAALFAVVVPMLLMIAAFLGLLQAGVMAM